MSSQTVSVEPSTSQAAQNYIEHICYRATQLRSKACKISHPGISRVHAEVLASHLPEMDSLRKLDIINCPNLNPEDIVLLCNALSKTEISHLSFEHVPIGTQGMQAITNLFRKKDGGDCQLKWLGMENNGPNIEPSAWNAFLSVASRTLESLNVSQNSLGNDQVMEIAQGLKDEHKLKALILSENSIDEEAMEILCEAIENNQSLLLLALGDCGITENGIQALAKALRHNCLLQRLYIYGNQLNLGSASYVEVQFWLEFNSITKANRSFLRQPECRSEYLPYILAKVKDHPRFLHGILQEMPHLWLYHR